MICGVVLVPEQATHTRTGHTVFGCEPIINLLFVQPFFLLRNAIMLDKQILPCLNEKEEKTLANHQEESWGDLVGLKVTWELGFRWILVECDSMAFRFINLKMRGILNLTLLRIF